MPNGNMPDFSGNQKRKLAVGEHHPLNDMFKLQDYLIRVNMEPVSMLSAATWEGHGNYRKKIAWAHFNKDGKVEVSDPELAPTEQEALDIAAELTAYDWPSIKPLYDIPMDSENTPWLIRNAPPDKLFLFRDDNGLITFLQVRIEGDPAKGTDKSYIPFTFWSDNVWRQVEPDLIPLYNFDLVRVSHKALVWLHEGAKAARHAQWLAEGATREARDACDAHPWGEFIRSAVHLGWCGGALRAFDTDWSPLVRSHFTGAYVVADNDEPGLEAVPMVSKCLSHWPVPVVAVRFDNTHWPPGFDMADPFPPKLFREPGRVQTYQGPSFFDCCQPATWATTKEGKNYKLRKVFTRQWTVARLESKALLVNEANRRKIWTEQSFNSAIKGYSDVGNTIDLLLKSDAKAVQGIAYVPQAELGDGIITTDDGRSVNTFMPSRVKPDFRADARLWKAYLKYMVPDYDERMILKRWLATLIARPDIKMKYGLLLASTMQGTGKGTLSVMLSKVLGSWNVSFPNETTIMGNYNSYLVHKRLIFVHEIYAGASWKAYNKLKSQISDTELTVSTKYVPEYEIDNWSHTILCSNSMLALGIENDDRRWFIPKVTELIRPQQEWVDYYAWMNADGPSAVVAWARNFVNQHGPVGESDRAPDSARKREMVADSRSRAETEIAALVEAARELVAEQGGDVCWADVEVEAWVGPRLPPQDRKPSPVMVRLFMEKAGMLRVKKPDPKQEPRFRLGREPMRLFYCLSPHNQMTASLADNGLKDWRDGRLPGDILGTSI